MVLVGVVCVVLCVVVCLSVCHFSCCCSLTYCVLVDLVLLFVVVDC